MVKRSRHGRRRRPLLPPIPLPLHAIRLGFKLRVLGRRAAPVSSSVVNELEGRGSRPSQQHRRRRQHRSPITRRRRSSKAITSSEAQSAPVPDDIADRNVVEATISTAQVSSPPPPPGLPNDPDEVKSLARDRLGTTDPAISVADAAFQCLEKETNMKFWWKAMKPVSGFSDMSLSQCIVDCMYCAVSEGNECLPFAVDAALCIAKEDELIIEWLMKRGRSLTNDEYALCRKIRWIAYRLFIFEGSWSPCISAALVDIRKEAERLVKNLRLDSDESVTTSLNIRRSTLGFICSHMHYKYQLNFSEIISEMPSESIVKEQASVVSSGSSSDSESSGEETEFRICVTDSEGSCETCRDIDTSSDEETKHKSSERAYEVSGSSRDSDTSRDEETKWLHTEKLNEDSKLYGLPEESEQSSQACGPLPLPPVSPNYADEFNSLESDRLRPRGDLKGPCDKEYKDYLQSFYNLNQGSGPVLSVYEAAFLCLEKENHKNLWRDAKSVRAYKVLDEWIVQDMFYRLQNRYENAGHKIRVEAALCLAKEAELFTEWLKKRGPDPLFHNKEEYDLWYNIRDVAFKIFSRSLYKRNWVCTYICGALVGIRKEAERLIENLRLGSDESITISLKIRESALAVIKEFYESYSSFLLSDSSESEGDDESDSDTSSIKELKWWLGSHDDTKIKVTITDEDWKLMQVKPKI